MDGSGQDLPPGAISACYLFEHLLQTAHWGTRMLAREACGDLTV